jgi:hypothetical protein
MKPLLCTLLLAGSLNALAQDRAEVAPSQIIGNRELPKVLYIVPWKKPQPDALNGKPPASVLDEVLAPIDREVFRRQQRYAVGDAAGVAASPNTSNTVKPQAATKPEAAPAAATPTTVPTSAAKP